MPLVLPNGELSTRLKITKYNSCHCGRRQLLLIETFLSSVQEKKFHSLVGNEQSHNSRKEQNRLESIKSIRISTPQQSRQRAIVDVS